MKNFHTDFFISNINNKKYNNKIQNKQNPPTFKTYNIAVPVEESKPLSLIGQIMLTLQSLTEGSVQKSAALSDNKSSNFIAHKIAQPLTNTLPNKNHLINTDTITFGSQNSDVCYQTENLEAIFAQKAPLSQKTKQFSQNSIQNFNREIPKNNSTVLSGKSNNPLPSVFNFLTELKNKLTDKLFPTEYKKTEGNQIKNGNFSHIKNQAFHNEQGNNEHLSTHQQFPDAGVIKTQPDIHPENLNNPNRKNTDSIKKKHKSPNNFNDVKTDLLKNSANNTKQEANSIPAKYFWYYLYLLALLNKAENNKLVNNKSNKNILSDNDLPERQNFKHTTTQQTEKNSKQNLRKTTDYNGKQSSLPRGNFPAENNVQSKLNKKTKSDVEKYYYTLSLLSHSSLNNFVERFSDSQDHNQIEERLKNTCDLVDYIEQSGVSHAVIKDFVKVHFDYFGNYHQDAFESFRVLKGNVENQKQTAYKVINILEHYKEKDNKDKNDTVKKLEKAFKRYGLGGNNEFSEYIDYLEHINTQNSEINKALLNSVKLKSEKCDLNTLLEFICRYKNYGIYIEHLHEFLALDKETENSIYRKFVDLHKNEPKISTDIKTSFSDNLKLIKANEEYLDAPSKRLVKQINTDTYSIFDKLQNDLSLEDSAVVANKLENADTTHLQTTELEIENDILKTAKDNYMWKFDKNLSAEEVQKLFNKIDTNSAKSKNTNLSDVSKNLTAKDITDKVSYINDLEQKNITVRKKTQKNQASNLYQIKKEAEKQTGEKQAQKQKIRKDIKTEQFNAKKQPANISQENIADTKQEYIDTKQISDEKNTDSIQNTQDKTIKNNTEKENHQNSTAKKPNTQENEIITTIEETPNTENTSKIVKNNTQFAKNTKKIQKSKSTVEKTEDKDESADSTQLCQQSVNGERIIKTKQFQKTNAHKKSEKNNKRNEKQIETAHLNNNVISLQSIIKLNQQLNYERNTKYGNQNREALEQYISQIRFKKYQSEQKAADRTASPAKSLLNL